MSNDKIVKLDVVVGSPLVEPAVEILCAASSGKSMDYNEGWSRSQARCERSSSITWRVNPFNTAKILLPVFLSFKKSINCKLRLGARSRNTAFFQ